MEDQLWQRRVTGGGDREILVCRRIMIGPPAVSERGTDSDSIDAFTASWNAGASPFVWVKTSDRILAKAVRKPSANSESGH